MIKGTVATFAILVFSFFIGAGILNAQQTTNTPTPSPTSSPTASPSPTTTGGDTPSGAPRTGFGS